MTLFFHEGAEKQTTVDAETWISLIKQYANPTELTAELLNTLIEKIVVHAPEGGRANRTQQVDIHFRFNVVTATTTADFKQYYVRRKAV